MPRRKLGQTKVVEAAERPATTRMRSPKILVGFVVVVVMATVLAVGQSTDPADAYCNGNVSGQRLFAATLRGPQAKEEPRWNSTCDGDGVYYGRLRDWGHGSAHLRLASSSNMKGEWVQQSASNWSGRTFRIYGSHWARVCRSNAPVGERHTSLCGNPTIHWSG